MLADALVYFNTHTDSGSALTSLISVAKICLRAPTRGGKSHERQHTRELQKRFDDWSNGNLEVMWREAKEESKPRAPGKWRQRQLDDDTRKEQWRESESHAVLEKAMYTVPQAA